MRGARARYTVSPWRMSKGIVLQSDKPSPKRSKSGGSGDDGGKRKDEAVGSALRSVYDNAVSEPVPDEMLDLLRKLG